MAEPKYQTLSAEALGRIVEGNFFGIAPTYTHEQRFALAELVARAARLEPQPDISPRKKRPSTPTDPSQ